MMKPDTNKFIHWVTKPASFYQFWLPMSGAIGGIILSLILGALFYFMVIK